MKRIGTFGWIACVAALVVAVQLAGCGEKKGENPPPPVLPERVEMGITVLITPEGIPNLDHFKVTLSKGVKPNQDHMRWRNQSGQKITIHFKSGWPFLGSVTGDRFDLEDGALSAWYTISPSATLGASYDYELIPTPGTPAPTDPSVSAEP